MNESGISPELPAGAIANGPHTSFSFKRIGLCILVLVVAGTVFLYFLTPNPRSLTRYVTHDPAHKNTAIEFLAPDDCSIDVDIDKALSRDKGAEMNILAEGVSIYFPPGPPGWLSNIQKTMRGNRPNYKLWVYILMDSRADQRAGVKVQHSAAGNSERDSLTITRLSKTGRFFYSIFYVARWRSSTATDRSYRPMQEMRDSLVSGFKISP
jgi:hypothetical protein